MLVWFHDNKIWMQREVKRTIQRKKIEEDARFIEFYWIYPNKKSKEQAIKEWSYLSEEEKSKAIESVPIYKKWCEEKYLVNWKLEKDKILHPSTYLHNKRWNDELEVWGKSKSDILREQETIRKRNIEEQNKKIEEEKERQRWEEIQLLIRRLEEKVPSIYNTLLQECISSITQDVQPWIKLSLAKIAMRKVVGDNLSKYKNLITYQ